MGSIHILPELIQNQIAAGEVIERPASLVKELVENSLDAGATSIRISIKEGGREGVRIQDNGYGMDREDLVLCCTRYATSKLVSEADLEAITSFGFRGEALASIASVSKVRIQTKQKDLTEGIELSVEGGVLSEISPSACPEGTIIEIEDLFYNTPARKKYLKGRNTEFAHITNLVQKFALVHPEVEFLLIHDGKTMLHVHPVEKQLERVEHVLGTNPTSLLPLYFQGTDIHMSGFVSHPHHTVGSRKHIHLFVNKRPIQSPLLSKAITESFHRRIAQGTYPTAIVNLLVDPSKVDINVHPRKLEVRFDREQKMFKLLYGAINAALDRAEQGSNHTSAKETTELSSHFSRPHRTVGAPRSSYAGSSGSSLFSGSQAKSPYSTDKRHSYVPQQRLDFECSMEPAIRTKVKYRILGQLQKCYILLEQEGRFLIVDQHAAHERVLFEKIRAKRTSSVLAGQKLLTPAHVELAKDHHSLLLEHLDVFGDLGFEIQDMGNGAVGIYQVPALLGDSSVHHRLEAILEDLDNQVPLEASLERTEEKVIAYSACKGAVQFGDELSLSEMEALVSDYFETPRRMTCPHGRPVVKEFSLQELGHFFKRPV